MTTQKTSLGRGFWERLRTAGEKPAVLEVSDDPKGAQLKSLTADQLQREAVEIAIGLMRQGVGPSDRVLLVCPARSEVLSLALAVWMLGAVTVHLEAGLSEALLSEALGRMKATWIVADQMQTLTALEVANGEAVGAAHLLMIDAPASLGARMVTWQQLREDGRKHRTVSQRAFGEMMFRVPPEARAMILYWEDAGALRAVALEHGETLEAMVPINPAWGLGGDAATFMDVGLSSREALLGTLRLLHHGHPLAFAQGQVSRIAAIRAARPGLLVIDARELDHLLVDLDRAQSESMDARALLHRGLDWVGRQRQDKDALAQAMGRVEGWLERRLAETLVKSLGGRLSRIWVHGGPLSPDAETLLKTAGVATARGDEA